MRREAAGTDGRSVTEAGVEEEEARGGNDGGTLEGKDGGEREQKRSEAVEGTEAG